MTLRWGSGDGAAAGGGCRGDDQAPRPRVGGCPSVRAGLTSGVGEMTRPRAATRCGVSECSHRAHVGSRGDTLNDSPARGDGSRVRPAPTSRQNSTRGRPGPAAQGRPGQGPLAPPPSPSEPGAHPLHVWVPLLPLPPLRPRPPPRSIHSASRVLDIALGRTRENEGERRNETQADPALEPKMRGSQVHPHPAAPRCTPPTLRHLLQLHRRGSGVEIRPKGIY